MRLVAVVIAAALSGCVSTATNRRMMQAEYIRGLQKARTIAHYQHCDEAVKTINAKLKAEDSKE